MILAAEMMQKNLPRQFVDEWVDWHDYAGFDKLYLFDHFSDEKLVYDHPKVEVFHADKKLIESHPHCNDANFKYFAMTWWWDHLIRHEEWDWMAFIDSDEFIVTPHNNLKNTIDMLEADAISLNWKNFGPADYEKDPEKTLLAYDKFLHHHATKVLASKDSLIPDYSDVMNCHLPPLKKESKLVNSSGREIPNDKCYSYEESYAKGLVSWDNIWINHYHLRSREDWFRKQKSMEKTNKDEMPWYWDEEHFESCKKTTDTDTTMIQHALKMYRAKDG